MNYYKLLEQFDDRYFVYPQKADVRKAANYLATYMFDSLGFLYPDNGRFNYESNRKRYEELKEKILASLPQELAVKAILYYNMGRHDT